jgi:SOS-response transcriptional repressor LexA
VKPIHDELEILEFIVDYKTRHDGVAPTLREIMDASKITSTSAAIYVLGRLVKQDKIRLFGASGQTRCIAVVGATWSPPAIEDAT